MKKLLVIIIVAIVIAIVLPMATCSRQEPEAHTRLDRTVPIGQILSSPQMYEGKTICIKGKVSESTGLFGYSWFLLTDHTGSIHVLGKVLSPANGEEVKVDGVVKQHFRFGDYNGIIFKITKQ